VRVVAIITVTARPMCPQVSNLWAMEDNPIIPTVIELIIIVNIETVIWR
jgi:hypothetical protein